MALIESMAGKVFVDLTLPKWIGLAVKLESPGVWRQVFARSSLKTGIFIDECIAISQKPSVLRLMLNTLKADRTVPSASDFAISMAYELMQQVNLQMHSWKIRNFAATVRREWLQTINESIILKSRFVNVRGSHPSVLMTSGASCPPEFDNVLQDRNELRKAFFMSYEVPDATEPVFVWLSGLDGSVKWSIDERITVKVGLNASVGADLGFFRVGTDYSLYDTQDKVQWLQIAYRDDQTAIESASFGQRCVGRITPNILWVKYVASSLKCTIDQLSSKHSFGVLNPSRFLGRWFNESAMKLQSCCVTASMLMPFGKYCRMSPLVFSLVPRSQEWCGLAK